MIATIEKLAFVVVMIGVGSLGCSRSADEDAPNATGQVTETGPSHDGWWCSEHGVPEEQCALCDVKLAADFKAKGDWCTEHNRPDSQCFVCHPENEAEFAALYEAKYGEAPPPMGTPHGDEHDHDHDHDESPDHGSNS
jgi:cobalt-zinc-cadmium efflux system membrane fusion protein